MKTWIVHRYIFLPSKSFWIISSNINFSTSICLWTYTLSLIIMYLDMFKNASSSCITYLLWLKKTLHHHCLSSVHITNYYISQNISSYVFQNRKCLKKILKCKLWLLHSKNLIQSCSHPSPFWLLLCWTSDLAKI